MWGVTGKQGYRCSECHYPCHFDCMEKIPGNCSHNPKTQEFHANRPVEEETSQTTFLHKLFSLRANPAEGRDILSDILSFKTDVCIRKQKYLTQETTFIVLQVLMDFIKENRTQLLQQYNCIPNGITDHVFRIFIKCLGSNQAISANAMTFKSLRVLFPYFNKPIFRLPNTNCGDICYELLCLCNSKFPETRRQATAMLYIMFQSNFDEMKQISRVKLQCTTAVSRMFGHSVTAPTAQDFEHLKASLDAISAFTKKQTQSLPYAKEVSELMELIYTLIDQNIKMEQYSFDPDTKAALYYTMSEGYKASPDLRITQLDKLSALHQREKNLEAAALTKVFTAALATEYIRLLGRCPVFMPDASVYTSVFPNVDTVLTLPKAAELTSLGDEICQGKQFSLEGYLSYMNEAIELCKEAGLYETCVEIYNIMLPIYRHQRDYKKQAELYGYLKGLCESVLAEPGRIFALYYRVYFHATKIPELHKKEFIYKVNGAIRIAEFKEKLKSYFDSKFGSAAVSYLSAVGIIDESKLSDDNVYLQVIDVKPFFTKDELTAKPSQYEQNFMVSKFIYESPFTKEADGKMYNEDPSKQWKRKVILNTGSFVFPFVTCRLEVKSRSEEELSPILVGMEAIAGKMQLLKNELGFVIDKKTLAIQLHGTLLTQVNAGPIAIAQIFLNKATIKSHDPETVEKLKVLFKSFVELLAEALTRQKPLIDTNEIAIQTALEESYFKFKRDVCALIDVIPDSITESFTDPALAPSPDAQGDSLSQSESFSTPHTPHTSPLAKSSKGTARS